MVRQLGGMVLNAPTSEIPQKPTDGISTDGTNNSGGGVGCIMFRFFIQNCNSDARTVAESGVLLNMFTNIG